MLRCRRVAAVLALCLAALACPAIGDDSQPAQKKTPLTEEVRIRWMAHIIKGVIGVAARADPEKEHYRYCVSGFTDQATQDVAGAVAKLMREPTGERPWLLPILIEKPSFRPSTYYDECTGGHFYFGDIGGDPLTMLNTHRRKQWLTIPNWPPYEELKLIFSMIGVSGIEEDSTITYADQVFAHEQALANDMITLTGAVEGSCEASAYPIIFYFTYDGKRVEGGGVWSSERVSGNGYGLACLSVADDTLHIDLTERLYKGTDSRQN